MSIFAHKLGRTVYFMLKRNQAFDADRFLAAVEVTLVDGTDLDQWRAALRPDTRAVFFESTSNPTLEVIDIRAVAELAHGVGATVIIDNVFATPVFSRAIELGADAHEVRVDKAHLGRKDEVVEPVHQREVVRHAAQERHRRVRVAVDQVRGTRPHTEALNRIDECGANLGMISQTEVIIAAERQQLLTVDHDLRTLRPVQHPAPAVQIVLFATLELFCEVFHGRMRKSGAVGAHHMRE